MEKWNKCCAEEIQRIWKTYGGSMKVVWYENGCPKCNHYIGLTQTSEIEATEFLKKYNLEYICEHNNQERVDYLTNICKDCGRLISIK